MSSVIENQEIVETLSPGQLGKIAQAGHPVIPAWMALSELKLRRDRQERATGQAAEEKMAKETLVDRYAGMTGIPGAKGQRMGRRLAGRPGAGGIRGIQQPQPGPQASPGMAPIQAPQPGPRPMPQQAPPAPPREMMMAEGMQEGYPGPQMPQGFQGGGGVLGGSPGPLPPGMKGMGQYPELMRKMMEAQKRRGTAPKAPPGATAEDFGSAMENFNAERDRQLRESPSYPDLVRGLREQRAAQDRSMDPSLNPLDPNEVERRLADRVRYQKDLRLNSPRHSLPKRSFQDGGGVEEMPAQDAGGEAAGEEGWGEVITDLPGEIWGWAKENPGDAAMIGLMLVPGGALIRGGITVAKWAPWAYRALKAGSPGKVAVGKALEKIPGLGPMLKRGYREKVPLPKDMSYHGRKIAEGMGERARQSRVAGGVGRFARRGAAATAVGLALPHIGDWWEGTPGEKKTDEETALEEAARRAKGEKEAANAYKALMEDSDERSQFRKDLAEFRGNIPGPIQNLGAALTAGGAAALAGDRTSWGGEGIGAFNQALRGGQALSQEGRRQVANLDVLEQQAAAQQAIATQRGVPTLDKYIEMYHGGIAPMDQAGQADIMHGYARLRSNLLRLQTPQGIYGESSPYSPRNLRMTSKGNLERGGV